MIIVVCVLSSAKEDPYPQRYNTTVVNALTSAQNFSIIHSQRRDSKKDLSSEKEFDPNTHPASQKNPCHGWRRRYKRSHISVRLQTDEKCKWSESVYVCVHAIPVFPLFYIYTLSAFQSLYKTLDMGRQNSCLINIIHLSYLNCKEVSTEISINPTNPSIPLIRGIVLSNMNSADFQKILLQTRQRLKKTNHVLYFRK